MTQYKKNEIRAVYTILILISERGKQGGEEKEGKKSLHRRIENDRIILMRVE